MIKLLDTKLYVFLQIRKFCERYFQILCSIYNVTAQFGCMWDDGQVCHEKIMAKSGSMDKAIPFELKLYTLKACGWFIGRQK